MHYNDIVDVQYPVYIKTQGDSICLEVKKFDVYPTLVYLLQLMLDLPYSRELEMEADVVGLKFAAKVCVYNSTFVFYIFF